MFFIQSFNPSFIHSLHVFRSVIHSFIHSLTRSFIHVIFISVNSFIYLFILSIFQSFMHSFIQSFVHSLIHSLIRSFIHSCIGCMSFHFIHFMNFISFHFTSFQLTNSSYKQIDSFSCVLFLKLRPGVCWALHGILMNLGKSYGFHCDVIGLMVITGNYAQKALFQLISVCELFLF